MPTGGSGAASAGPYSISPGAHQFSQQRSEGTTSAATGNGLPQIGPDGRYQGTMRAWNAEKGFGFVHVNGMEDDIFVHIADCIGSQPQVNDIISFETEPSHKKDGTTNLKA
ncbi:unnamed protein product, partial [Effrenium voratum]